MWLMEVIDTRKVKPVLSFNKVHFSFHRVEPINCDHSKNIFSIKAPISTHNLKALNASTYVDPRESKNETVVKIGPRTRACFCFPGCLRHKKAFHIMACS
jgi:hypothetical protein